jgi:hypothetical protein
LRFAGGYLGGDDSIHPEPGGGVANIGLLDHSDFDFFQNSCFVIITQFLSFFLKCGNLNLCEYTLAACVPPITAICADGQA